MTGQLFSPDENPESVIHYAASKGRGRVPEVEQWIMSKDSVIASYWFTVYARVVVGRRIPEFERYLLEHGSSVRLAEYATRVARCRIPEFERRMVELPTPPMVYYLYAESAARCRIPEFEEAIAKCPNADYAMYIYARNIAKCRVPVFEEKLRNFSEHIYWVERYIKDLVRHRDPAFERANLGMSLKI